MVRLKDGSVLAQMGRPSMILPILVALYYPQRGPAVSRPFDPFEAGCNNLTFEKCDTEVFRLVGLAYEVGRQGGLLPAVMNAANETAVMSFLAGNIGFTDIEKTVYEVCDIMAGLAGQKADIDSVTQADREARAKAEVILRKNNR
jgi:1-deoxy-D-xylulose-5-phosphate reductoisomerase